MSYNKSYLLVTKNPSYCTLFTPSRGKGRKICHSTSLPTPFKSKNKKFVWCTSFRTNRYLSVTFNVKISFVHCPYAKLKFLHSKFFARSPEKFPPFPAKRSSPVGRNAFIPLKFFLSVETFTQDIGAFVL